MKKNEGGGVMIWEPDLGSLLAIFLKYNRLRESEKLMSYKGNLANKLTWIKYSVIIFVF